MIVLQVSYDSKYTVREILRHKVSMESTETGN